MRVQPAHEGLHHCGTRSLIDAHDWCSHNLLNLQSNVRHWMTKQRVSFFSFLLRLKSGQGKGSQQPAARVQLLGSKQPGGQARPNLWRAYARVSYPRPVPTLWAGMFKSVDTKTGKLSLNSAALPCTACSSMVHWPLSLLLFHYSVCTKHGLKLRNTYNIDVRLCFAF